MLKTGHAAETESRAAREGAREFYDELAALFATIEETTGLEVCIYPSEGARILQESGVNRLPHSFFSHFGDFCRIVKANRTGRGCGGHDSLVTVGKSAGIGRPFVNICHAGLGEVVFPMYGYNNLHIASVFIGQAITDEIDAKGFPEIVRRVCDLGVDEKKLRAAYDRLPRMSREKLLRIGTMADLAVRGLGALLDFEVFEHQIMLNQYPAMRRALRMIADSKGNISEGEMADALNLHQSYLSRLFKKVMKCGFKSYVTRRRIQQAKVMLHHTGSSVMNISGRCGFARQSYFTRKFRNVTGMTPSEYRRSKSVNP